MARTLPHLLGCDPTSDELKGYLQSVANAAGVAVPTPTVKSYPDTVYHNFYALGVSLQFKLANSSLQLDCIDLYNTGSRTFSQYPMPIFAKEDIQITPEMTGQEIVAKLAEPSRKGGGQTVDIWCDWSQLGIFVEFGGTKGPNAWENGGKAVWTILSQQRGSAATP